MINLIFLRTRDDKTTFIHLSTFKRNLAFQLTTDERFQENLALFSTRGRFLKV